MFGVQNCKMEISTFQPYKKTGRDDYLHLKAKTKTRTELEYTLYSFGSLQKIVSHFENNIVIDEEYEFHSRKFNQRIVIDAQ